MNVIVCGGDGFCGFPTALYLSDSGYDVTIVDNLSRRKIDVELGIESLTPIKPIEQRLKTWKELTGKTINYEYIDVSDHYHRVLRLIEELRPYAIVHFAEQRSAPYSMKSSFHKRYTINNNINATNNILAAIVESGVDTHLVHLGSTGVYSYSSAGMSIPEGYLKIKVETDYGIKDMEIMYPPGPGSIYHLSKVEDAIMFAYYNDNDDVRITDLHQGIVWGCQTKETMLHDDLINRWDYDGYYGTLLNRFIIQSKIDHPLTIYGVGGQTRAFIHIQNSVECIRLAIDNPPKTGERVRIFNQTTECLNIKELALKIQALTGAEIRYYKNPRKEPMYNDLKFTINNLLHLGLKPITLSDGLLFEIMEIADKYGERINKSKILSETTWNKNIFADLEGNL